MKTLLNPSLEEFRQVLQTCSGKRIALDTETTGLYWWSDHLTSIGFHCPQADIEGCIDFPVERIGADEDVTEEEMVEWSKQVRSIVLECLKAGTIVVMHNAKFDLHFLGIDAEKLGWRIIDTTVLIHLLDSRLPKAMKQAEEILLGTNSKRQHVEEAPPRKKVWDWDSQLRQKYCVNDTRVTYQFAESLYPKIKDLELEKLFRKDMSYLTLLWQMERRGFLTDQTFIHFAEEALRKHQEDLETQLYDALGKKINWRSNKQLSPALYEDLGIERPKNPFADADGVDRSRFAERGKYNSSMTSTFILMEKAHHPLGELISSLREATKLQRTLQQWLELSDEEPAVHSNFNLTGTRTRRLSSSKPNLQNVASNVRSRFTQGVFTGGIERTEEFNLRNAFIARPGKVLLSVDYKQMEMRMFGILSGDPFMLSALASGVDIHMWIAKRVWGDCGEESNLIHREWSKTISFGLIYGMTTGSLQFKLNMSRSEAQKVTDDYWNAFPRIRPWLFEIIDYCKEHKFVRYWSGALWREENEMDMFKGANAVIQGGCAELLSIAALRVRKWLQQQGEDYGGIVSLVHDEIISEVLAEDVQRAAKEISSLMEVPDLFDLPFLTDAKIGNSYGSLEKMKIT